MILSGIPALLSWCRQVTSGYKGVKIENLTESWRSGLGFCAVIARFRPDLVDYAELDRDDIVHNCYLAFSIGEKYLGIPALLDAKDMERAEKLDELSIITYLAQLYHRFSEETPQPPVPNGAKGCHLQV